jgi:lipoate-protein ligase A
MDAGLRTLAIQAGTPFLRFYGWTESAVTFGYSQKWDSVRAACGEEPGLVRRETGGGIVDHRHDLTYAFALPSCHQCSDWSAIQIYCRLHEALANALHRQGIDAELAPCRTPDVASPGLATACFQRAEPSDVISPENGRKIAGAAMRRHGRTLLVQGSLDRHALPSDWNDAPFKEYFTEEILRFLGRETRSMIVSWPDDVPSADLLEQFRADSWNQKR